jgi:hypothetical protein
VAKDKVARGAERKTISGKRNNKISAQQKQKYFCYFSPGTADTPGG